MQPEIVVVDTSVLGSNSQCSTSATGSTGDSSSPDSGNLPTEATKTLYGCASGLSVVQLRDEANNKTLATVTVTVLPLPVVSSSRRIGYRWFNIDWQAAPDYTSFTIEWRDRRDPHATPVTPPKAWSQLASSGQSGPRALMGGHSADIRGIGYVPDTDIEVRVVGMISGERAASPTYRVARGKQPAARGHLPDHTMRYRDTISSSGANATLAGWIKPQLWSAASAWADLVPELDLEACSTTCARNEDKEIFWVDIDVDCNIGAVACVKGLPAFNLGLELEGKIVGSGLRMVFVPETAAYRAHEWTDDPTEDDDETPEGRRIYWIDRVVVHEFGHTFGLADRDADGTHPDPNYRGIMNRLTGDKGIKLDDRAALWAIYRTTPEMKAGRRAIMAGRLWIAALLIALSMACGETAAPAPPVPVQESVVVVPAAQNDPDALAHLLSLNNDIGLFVSYRGVQSLETTILESDVIARVSYLSKRSSSVLRPDTSYYPWTAMLEFRFTVHEYLKGTGPAEIGGIVYMAFETETQARLAAARIGTAHDSRWESREAIVFLYLPGNEVVHTVHDVHWGAALPTTSDQYLFGRMIELTAQYKGEAYSVASAHRKLWLPAAETPSQGASGSSNNNAPSPDDKLFLLDAPAPVDGASGAVSVTLPTISQGSMKSKITALEAEANRGGTSEYRKCVEISYRYENNLRGRVELHGPMPHVRYTSDIGAGLPAGTVVYNMSRSAPSETNVGLTWFEGPDKDLVTDVNVDFTPWDGGTVRYKRRVVTTRPLPAGEYAPNPGGTWHGGMVCARYPAIADNYRVIEITVTAPPRTLHEAFFDPVAIGSAVGADETNGVLKPTAFSVGNTATTISSLKWESGAVTMILSPTASLAGHQLDFIALDGSITTTLAFDDATQNGGTLTWSAASQPWNAGDLLMLRIHRPVSTDATLSSLALSGVDLTFTPATTTYAASVPATTTQTTVTPTPNHDSASYVVKLAGVVDDDGIINLAVGENVITVEVTAEDTTTTETYTVTVTRATPPVPITVTLSPRVEGSETYVNLTIEWSDPGACDGQHGGSVLHPYGLSRQFHGVPSGAGHDLSQQGVGHQVGFRALPGLLGGRELRPQRLVRAQTAGQGLLTRRPPRQPRQQPGALTAP